MNFQELKKVVLAVAEKKAPDCSQTKKLSECNTIEELYEIAKDNLGWVRNHLSIQELVQKYDNPEVFNIGKDNSGLFNSGDRNSGYRNSGDLNSGYRNSGDLNSGDRNSGYRNSGDLNSGYLNSGDLNSGYRNSGDRNSGDLNSGDLNSGYRNSGVFCTRKREDTVSIFNKDSGITWDEWYNHPAYSAAYGLIITEWVSWNNMTDEEKKNNPKAFVPEGYVKVYEYKEAWANLWKALSDSDKNSFKTLPNYDPDIFEEVTGIRFE